ncbi:hypothetical protein EfmAA818_15490 [Enterococcus faecium]|nr:hypothetical protein EfmAA818_15490 [Enterococcus faecium]
MAELPETLDDSFREKLQNLLTYEEGITNAMIYPYSNGKIEAKNTHIKTMKRVSYGFKSFENMRIRIFLINQLINAFRDKDPDLFFSLLAELPETLDDSFREKLQNLLTYEEGITNAMIYPYSNGKIEAKNTHIKTMKRVSYGFKSFENMRIRIFLINQLINVR